MKATQPPFGWERAPALQVRGRDRVYVKVVEESSGSSWTFSFTDLPLDHELTVHVGECFALATGPLGSRRTLRSARSLWRDIRRVIPMLAGGRTRLTFGDLRPEDVARVTSDPFAYRQELVRTARRLFAGDHRIRADTRALLMQPRPARVDSTLERYSDQDFRTIRRACRQIAKNSVQRIRRTSLELDSMDRSVPRPARTRAGALLLAAETGDVPRESSGRVYADSREWRTREIFHDLFLSRAEVMAWVLLLVCHTGMNFSTASTLGAESFQATFGEPHNVELIRAKKPRRGPARSELDIALVGTGTGKDDYGSALGVFRLAREVCERARHLAKTPKLFVWRRDTSPAGFADSLSWSDNFTEILSTLAGSSLPPLSSRRLRLTYLAQIQRPIAHSPRTFVSTYMVRDLGAVEPSQKLVANVLTDEVDRLVQLHQLKTITADQLNSACGGDAQARRQVALPLPTLRSLSSGSLETVVASCTDVDDSGVPFNRCRASFLICLECECARSIPANIPAQAVTVQELDRLRAELDPREWDARFAGAYAALTDLLQRQHADLTAASDADPELRLWVSALLEGELDL